MMRSPIYYDKALRAHIDLSQLAQVGDIMGTSMYENAFFVPRASEPMFWIGFNYWFNHSQEPVKFRRPLHFGPDRHQDLTLVDPSRSLETVGEEAYRILTPDPKQNLIPTHTIYPVHEKTDELQMARNLNAQRQRLIRSWQAWKRVEPEIYAIIRKHLS